MADLDFNSRTLTQSVSQVKPVGNFILKTFFNEESFSDTKCVDVVIKKDGRKVAPFVSPKLAFKANKMSHCSVSVGVQVEGPHLCKRI